MGERLIETIERETPWISDLTFGNKFFMTMNEQQQQSFFGSIFNLRVWSIMVREAADNITENPAITISTSALLENLPQLHMFVGSLTVTNFALTCQSDVQALSNIVGSKCETLQHLSHMSIKCPVDDCNKEASDESDGFLDPLFYAASGLDAFWVLTKGTHSVHLTLVSPTALRALFVEGKRFRELYLNDLGLTDSHVLAIVDGLSTPGIHLNYLNLTHNQGITAQAYGALLNLSDRASGIGRVSLCNRYEPCADEKAWEGKLNLVSEMNSEYRRLEYMTNGTFTSEECRWQWLERVASLASSDEEDEDRKKERDAKHLNFIWYTLCENPEMMQVSQAPTRTRKRKAT
jgi:hypothetical protein